MKKIPLTKDKFALVDDEDYAELSQYKWQFNAYGYAARSTHENGKKGYITMHKQIMQTPSGMDTDHINHNRLDNRRSNLRICTRSQNVINSTRTNRGATLVKATGKWMSRITINGKTKFLGYYATELGALEAYNRAAPKLHGAFTQLNQGEAQ